MSGIPMEVAVALSLLLAQVNSKESGWHGKMFTFDSTPEMVTVVDEADENDEAGEKRLVDIGKLVEKTKELGWGGSTNLDLTMSLFLETSIANKTPPAEVANQCLVIFSDMEFDNIERRDVEWETAHQAITAKFTDAGYPSAPLIVYWNLRASRSTPVQKCATPGVILLAGFSAGLLKSFLAGNLDEFTPIAQMNAVLGDKVFEDLAVAVGDK